MGAFKLTKEQERRLVVDYSDGIASPSLVIKYGVSESTVWRILADYGAPKRHSVRTKRKPLRKSSTKKLKPCGTNAAYARHIRNGESPCLKCTDAHSANQKEWHDGKRSGSDSQSST